MNKSLPYIIGAALIYLLIKKVGINGKGIVNGISGMLKSNFLPPYNSEGKTTFGNIKNKSGVYIIKENNKIVYVGYSGKNLYRTLYRHFQQWNHTGQEVITYANKLNNNDYKVRVITTTPAQAYRLEIYLINKLKPRDNTNQQTPEDNAGFLEYKKLREALDLAPTPF